MNQPGTGGGTRRRWLILTLAGVTVLAVVAVWAFVTREPETGAQPSTPPESTMPVASAAPSSPTKSPPGGKITDWAYQLQEYPAGRLDAMVRGPYQLAVIDLARDAHTDYFTSAEIDTLRRSGKRTLAYFEIGSIENFRPEYPMIRRDAEDLVANEWPDWPGEYFVCYWDARWWERVVKPRLDQALQAGFDGAYLDTPLAYEEISLGATGGRGRERLAADMTALIVRISQYAKARRPGFLIVPQNSPELREQPGYTTAIDGIAMEELFYLATDEPCTRDWCAENLAHTRALRDAGKFVLAVDYAVRTDHIRAACGRYRAERFAGTVTVRELDRLTAPCA